MGLWSYCEACGKRIETGEPCIGVKKYSEHLCGDSICLDCAKIENLPDGKAPVSITDLLSRAEAAEKRADRWEEEVKAYSESDLAKAHDLLSADWAKQKIRADAAEARAEKAEKCIYAIEDDLDRGNDNDRAREHIAEWKGQKEE